MSDQLNAINAALAAAKQSAAAQVPAAPVAPSTPANYNAPPVQGGRPVSMREMLQESGMAVDKYLKVDKAGFLIGDDAKNIVDEIEVEFTFSEAKAFYSVRYGQNPVKYSKSFDKIVDARTKRPWADVVAQAQALDPKCTGDYRALDLPFRVVNDIKSLKGELLLEAGKRLGWTSSVTNWKIWAEFSLPFYNLMDAGVLPENATLRGKIVHKQETRNGNTWGLLTFEDFTVSALEEDQAAA